MYSQNKEHGDGDCEICAAQQESDMIGAIPTAGHQPATIESTAAAIAEAIYHHDTRVIRELLVVFAEEIKRQAVEP